MRVNDGFSRLRALGVEGVEVGAPVLHAGELAAHREAHLAGLAGHVEALEQLDEVRVVAVVEDDEAGVDGVVLQGAVGTGQLDVDGVGVAADPGAGLEDGHVVVRVEQVGADEPRDPGSDDGDPHRASCVVPTGSPDGGM